MILVKYAAGKLKKDVNNFAMSYKCLKSTILEKSMDMFIQNCKKSKL